MPSTGSVTGARTIVVMAEPTVLQHAWRLAPGLAVTAVAVAVAFTVSWTVPALGPLTVAILAGVAFGNTRLMRVKTRIPGAAETVHGLRPGIDFAAKRLLRVGVVLLGLRLAASDLLALGLAEVAVIIATASATFACVMLLGPRIGVARSESLLIATGFSICGASAIAAMSGVTGAKNEETTRAITLVTLFGTLVLAAAALLQPRLGLTDHEFGIWAGASIHEVGQVVGAAAVAGETALLVAVVAKLGRVALLAPLIAGVATLRRRHGRAEDGQAPAVQSRAPLLPVFVVGFLIAVGVRSADVLPPEAIGLSTTTSGIVLSAAMFGLGVSVHLPTLVKTSRRPAVLGAVTTGLTAIVAYGGLLLLRQVTHL